MTAEAFASPRIGEGEHAASPTERQTRIRRKRDLKLI